jgi:ATP-dependent exoDNAse (exonuclease V) beta subunit
MKLTPQQHDAVHRIGQDVCVIAGPGSGKTRVLAERFAWLVNEKNISPRNILALTFTEKAANEIKERVSKSNHPDIEFAPISTFHGLCKRILSEFSIAAGLDPATQLWDERIADAELHSSAEQVLNQAASEQRPALRRLFTTWNTANLVPDLCDLYNKIRSLSDEFPQPSEPPNIPRFLAEFAALGEDVVAAKATTAISQGFHERFCEGFALFKQLGYDEPRWEHIAAISSFPKRGNLPKGLKEPAKQFYELFDVISATLVSALVGPERNYLIELLQRIADAYDERKRNAARMDFHDLEHKSIHLLRNNKAVREELQRRFEHILMDEMQDTNPVQWKLLDLIRTPGTFFAVGDVNQSIYGFRFAAPKEFIEYRDSIEARGGAIDFLGDNFRSREDILHFTETVSRGLAGLEPPNLRAGRNFKTQNLPVSLHAFEQHEDEFAWLASEIRFLEETFLVEPKDGSPLRRLHLGDIAILVRTTSKAEAIASVMAERGIPFTLGGGRKFFDTQEVADCISYLEVLANPLNTIAFAAVLRSPFVGLTDDQLLNNYQPQSFQLRLEKQRKQLDDICPDRFLIEALDASGYLQTLNPGGRANVEKFLRIVREQWQQGPSNIRDFADTIQQMRTAAQEKSAPVAGIGAAVQILTVHASKGLEFPIVFVAGAYFSKPANRASLSFAPPDRVGVRWTNPINGKTLPDGQARAIEEEQKQEEEHELQRQLYVALTRAEQKLYVSWAGTRKIGWLKYLEQHKDLQYTEGEELPLPDPEQAPTQQDPILLRPLPSQPVIQSSSTPTDISKYAQCPRRYFLDSVANLASWPKTTEVEATGAAALGTAVHQILADQEVENDTPEARELAQVFLDSPIAKSLETARWIEREFDIVFAIEDLVLQGQIDLCYEDANGEITIIDYKTDRGVSKHYEIQMAIYREAISKLHPGKPVRSYLYFLRSNQLVESSEKLSLKLIRDFKTASTFDTKEGAHCQRCPHLAGACPVLE